MNADSNGQGCSLFYNNCNMVHTERAFIRAPLFGVL